MSYTGMSSGQLYTRLARCMTTRRAMRINPCGNRMWLSTHAARAIIAELKSRN